MVQQALPFRILCLYRIITEVSPEGMVLPTSEAVWLVWTEALTVVVYRGLPKDIGSQSDHFPRWPGDVELMAAPPCSAAGRDVLKTISIMMMNIMMIN